MMKVIVAEVKFGLGSSLSNSGRLSLPLAVVAVVSVAVAMAIAMSVATIAVAMAVAVPGLSQYAANKGKRKNSQQLHDVFGSSFSETRCPSSVAVAMAVAMSVAV